MKKNIVFLLMLIVTTSAIYSQGLVAKGNVIDETEEPMIGVSIQVVGTSSGTITDFDGNFSIPLPKQGSKLKISYVGYKTQEIVAKAGVVKIKLEPESKLLDEVVIVGFGSQPKVNLTGAVNTIDSKAIESRPISDAVQGLQGVVAGLNITNDQGGAPGQAMEINIRGVGSIGEGSNSAPLVLIDGVEGDLSTINPNDIVSFSVLKDAAAASIYGSRAPFGVILVTTKSGTKTTVINYKGDIRVQNPISVPTPADSYNFALYVNEAFTNTGGNAQFSQQRLDRLRQYVNGDFNGTNRFAGILINDNPDADNYRRWTTNQENFANNNWYDIHLKDISISQEHNLSISGGGDKATYYVSANYMRQEGIFTYADDYYQRFSISGKVNISILKNLKLDWQTRFINTIDDKPSSLDALFFHNLGRISPFEPLRTPAVDSSGNIIIGEYGDYWQASLIPGLQNGGRQRTTGQQLYNQANFTYEPIKNWKVYVNLGSRVENPRYTRQFKALYQSQPDGELEPIKVLQGVADKTVVNSNGTFTRQPAAGVNYYEKMSGFVNYFNLNAFTDYFFEINKHNFKFLAGMQAETYYNEQTRVASDNILLDDTPFLPSSAGTNPMMSEKKGEWANLGFFGRLNYNYANRYMIEINARGDAASRFPSSQRWGFFPSGSLGWNVAQEEFWETLADQGFEVLKPRFSYGVLGNQNTSSFYPYFQQMTTSTGNFIIGGQNVTVIGAPSPYSTYLTWEKSETIDFGLDIVALKNRLLFTFDWYQRTTRDMVGPANPLPAIYGATPPRTNNAEVRTRGWEVELTWRDNIKKFRYEVKATLSDYETVVTKYDSPDGALSGYYAGRRLGDIWGYQVDGIAKSDLEMQEWLANNSQEAISQIWGAGDMKYKDINGDGKVNNGGNTIYDKGDLTVIGNGTPRFAYGLRMSGSWKWIDFSLFFQGVGKRDVFFNGSATFFGMTAPWQRSIYVEHLDYFRLAGSPNGENVDSYYARPRSDGANQQVSDYYLQNAAYLRLKNVQIGFSLPTNTKISKVVKNARIYFSAENLLTFTDLKIYDPEAIGSSISEYGPGKVYPKFATYSCGLNVTF